MILVKEISRHEWSIVIKISLTVQAEVVRG